MKQFMNAEQMLEEICGEKIVPAVPEKRDERLLVSDDATASFDTERKFCSALKFRTEHDVEMEVLPSNFKFGAYMYDAPLVNVMLRDQYGDEVADSMIEAATQRPDATCLIMKHPAMDGCHYTWHPVMNTALMGVCRVTGLSGQSLMRTVPTTGKRVMDQALKTKVLNAGKDLYNPIVKVLIRDGEIAGIRTSKYAVLDQTEGYQAVRSYCLDTYGSTEVMFHMASMSEATTVAELNCGEEALCNLKQRLLDNGVATPKLALIVRYVTSDVTDSAMRAEPFVLWGEGDKALLIPFGDGVATRHETGNTVEGFAATLSQLAKSQQEAEDAIEELGNTEIRNVDGCLQRVAKEVRQLGLSDAVVKQQIDKLTASGETSGTAIDVFLSLQECIAAQCRKGNVLDVERYVQMTESSVRLLSVRYKVYDLPFDPDLYK